MHGIQTYGLSLSVTFPLMMTESDCAKSKFALPMKSKIKIYFRNGIINYFKVNVKIGNLLAKSNPKSIILLRLKVSFPLLPFQIPQWLMSKDSESPTFSPLFA